MADKVTPEAEFASHNEKTAAHQQDHEPELADSDGRRHSVAMNIVHNPLQVSLGLYKISPSIGANWLL